ncbi:hypothetical protein D479_06283 [Halobacillus sp. BAB-2008]|nr:hypothetical protein D479_06283 [Halobacillus sp. BAB-2008]
MTRLLWEMERREDPTDLKDRGGFPPPHGKRVVPLPPCSFPSKKESSCDNPQRFRFSITARRGGGRRNSCGNWRSGETPQIQRIEEAPPLPTESELPPPAMFFSLKKKRVAVTILSVSVHQIPQGRARDGETPVGTGEAGRPHRSKRSRRLPTSPRKASRPQPLCSFPSQKRELL